MAGEGFWTGKRVLLTGHTGFKGSWLSLWLEALGAEVYGLALAPDTAPSLFDQLGLAQMPGHALGDIRAPETVAARVAETAPDIVFHLAAQPLVLCGYRAPLETWASNVMGTAHVLDALRAAERRVAVLCITTDKVYENREWVHAYREPDRLGGHDPYSASKAACELVIDSYRRSCFAGGPVRVASARAGNVIGGGDWAKNRILPDLARARAAGEALAVRNPAAVRPWQHVLDPLAGYLMLAEALWEGRPAAGSAFNFGPDPAEQRSVRELVGTALRHWPGNWRDASDPDAPHEAGRLSLATDKARALLGWAPRWGFAEAVARTMEWYRGVHEGADARALSLGQIAAFSAGAAR